MMKNFNALTRFVLVILCLGFINSCSDSDENTENQNPQNDILEVQRAAEIDQIDAVLGSLVLDSYEAEETDLANRTFYDGDIPACVTITVIAQQNYREITLDFGNVGCVVNGHLLRGQLVFDYTRNPEAQQILINYNLVDFYFDAKQVLGSRTILRELSNENGNPQFTHNLSLTVIWPNGAQASRQGTKVREWIEGFGSGVFNDNVFEITGDWTTTFINGNSHIYEVLLPLRREAGCTYFVSGNIDVQRTNFGGLFDYGNGECDSLASFTFNNGQEIEINLD